MNRDPSGRACESVRGRLIDAVMGDRLFDEASLDEATRSHLAECPECRAFLDQLLAVQRLAAEAYREMGADVEEAAQAEPDMRAIEAAIDEGMARAAGFAVSPMEASKRAGASLLERVAFLLFSLVVVGSQFLLMRRLGPVIVLALQAGLNWVAPFVLYAVYALNKRARKEAAR